MCEHTDRTQLLTKCLQEVAEYAKALSEIIPDGGASVRFELRNLIDFARMLEWFQRTNPKIWPAEMRALLASHLASHDSYQHDIRQRVKMLVNIPVTDSRITALKDMLAAILKAQAASIQTDWHDLNDYAIYVGLGQMALQALWLIVAIRFAEYGNGEAAE